MRECELNTQGLAPQDPCYGTYKYYTTNYICIPAGEGFFFFLHFPVNLNMSFSVQACNYRLLPEISVTCHGGYSYLKCGKQFYSKFVLIVTLDHKTSFVAQGIFVAIAKNIFF